MKQLKNLLEKLSSFKPLSIGLVAGIMMGWAVNYCVLGDDKAASVKKDKYQALEMFNKVLHLVEQNYVEDVNSADIVEKGVKGMLEGLDPHTSYLNPQTYKDMKVETSGKFTGIGTEISIKDKVLTVVTPIDETPAFKAGIEPGDKIIKIYPNGDDKKSKGYSTKNMSLEKAVNLMRGKSGSKVKLTIWREGSSKPRDFIIPREEIKVASVKSDLVEKDFGYVRVTQFQDSVASDVRKAITKLTNENKGKLKGLVLDLRNNPGGLLDEAWKLSDIFIEEGIVVSTIGRDKNKKEVKSATKEDTITDLNLAVLINGASASASEIVAGAIQDHKRGIVVGQQSFGKGSVQTIMDLGDGSALKLTIARYYTPSGKSIQSHGIKPDIELDNVDYDLYKKAVIPSKWYKERDLEGHLENEEGEMEEEDFSISELNGQENQKPEEEKQKKKPNMNPKEDLWVKQSISLMKANNVFANNKKTDG